MTATILLLTTDDAIAEAVRSAVAATAGCELHPVPNLDQARSRLLRGGVSLAIVHVPGQIGVDQAKQIVEIVALSPTPAATVVLSECDDARFKLSLLRLGVADVLARPIDLSRLAFLVDILTVRARLGEAAPAKAQASGVAGEDNGQGKATRPTWLEQFLFGNTDTDELLGQVQAVAPLESTVLLTGETGTGKTHLARVLHRLSLRRDRPFLVVQCGALSPALAESELFGHVQGAFTTAERDRTGKFAEAGDGTLLLDDVDALPLHVQAKLLRAVDDRVFEAVGCNREKPLRARLVVATNRSLGEEIDAGRFRSDLYYRLNVVNFHLPPLRDRQELIRPLAEKFLDRFCSRDCRTCAVLSDGAAEMLEGYHWPGNVRELRNVMERTVALCPNDFILSVNLPRDIGGADGCRKPAVTVQYHRGNKPSLPGGNELRAARNEAERRRLLDALQRTGNNRTRAASELGVSRATLYKKLHKFGLT